MSCGALYQDARLSEGVLDPHEILQRSYKDTAKGPTSTRIEDVAHFKT